MTARAVSLAGVVVLLASLSVLAGWGLDVTSAKSLLPGWRVMVPSSAFSFACIGAALAVAGSTRGSLRERSAVVTALAAAGLVLPALTLVEYASGARTGLEGWLGFTFSGETLFAGRMSPLTSATVAAVALAVAATAVPGASARRLAQVSAGAALFTSWLAVIALSFDTERLVNEPRFPGMAVVTVGLVTISSAATLLWTALSQTDGRFDYARGRWLPWALTAAFLSPVLLAQGREIVSERGWIDPQLVTAAVTLGFSLIIAAIVVHIVERLSNAQLERERVLGQLEDRVNERTYALATTNAELRAREDELRDADRRKDEFLATLAHELRNPLAPIRNAATVIRSEAASLDQQRYAGAIIERQVTMMRRLIDDLLDVSRITAGRLQVHKARVDLAEVVDLAIATNRPHIEASGHRVRVVMPDVPVFVDGDAARLSQAFANLIHNACKFTESGGEIAVSTRLTGDAVVEIVVRDNGVGIPPGFLPRLFEKFSQVAPPLERSQGGLGLGLSIAQGILSMHGGTVSAHSDGAGSGSEFVVRLPVAESAHGESSATRSITLPRPPVAKRVLVVDDNTDSAASLALILTMEGHVVEVAHDGVGALRVAENFRPDVMLLDLGMPKVSGFEVCRQVRTAPWGKSILLIAQTGWGQENDRRRSRDAGFDWHLTKPVDVGELRDILLTSVAVAGADPAASGGAESGAGPLYRAR